MGIGKYKEKREKKNYCSTKTCISFHERWFEQQFIPSDNYFIKFYVYFYVCSYLKYLLAVVPFVKSLTLLPTLYKFIVLGSYLKSFRFGLQIVTLQGLLTSLLPLIINTLINQYTHNNFLFVKQFMGYK